MSKDKLSGCRAKSRCIVELRYVPLVQAFDKRGALLETLNAAFKDKMPHWRAENVAIRILNDPDATTREIAVDHKRYLLAYEDPGTVQEFLDDGKRVIQLVHSVLPDLWEGINRIGVRFISVLKADGYGDFADIHAKVMSTFFAPRIPLSLAITDCRAVLEHETGRMLVGPARRGEAWLREVFSTPDAHMPEIGFGLDTDNYVVNPKIGSVAEVITAFTTVYEQTLATEYEVAAALGLRSKNG